MQRTTISLDGDWERRDFLDEAWRWSDAVRGEVREGGPPAQAGISAGWRPGSVPGSTVDDAWRAGEIPNPYLDRNSLAAEWVPQRTWLYRRRLRVPDRTAAHASLRFEGIDPGGTVLLDGEEVATHRGMFLPFEIDLSGWLEPGTDHLLIVAVDPAAAMPSQVSRTEQAREHHTRMAYGWDFCPRLVSTGIWRSVTLDLHDARLGHPRIEMSVADDHSRATLDVRAEVAGAAPGAAVSATLLDAGGTVVAKACTEVAGGEVEIGLDVARPRLWWPNGSGEPYLHRLVLRLETDELLDELEWRVGVRSISAAPTAGAAPDARPYTMVVNGRATWIRGWNWVPLDALHGVPRPDRLAHLIELARRANVNLLRVWGGGLIESEAFYDACDAAGIMVWQEFVQSSSGVSNAPSDDAAFVDLMRREAEDIVPLRAHHPSLAIWCGGNELSDADGVPLDERHPVLAALADVVGDLDPGRIWLPTSPSGPRFENALAAVGDDPASLHDVHGPWEHQGLAEQRELAAGTTSLLHSEFGAEGMTNLATLRATVSEEHRRPPDRSNPVMAHRGAWWINEPRVQALFGGDLGLEELERASQHLQADGLRTLVEGDRRRWPRNAGAVPWQLNESFPNAWSTAAVDWFGLPKAAYDAVREAYAPIFIGLGLAAPVLDGRPLLALSPWVANDTDEAHAGPMRITLHDVTGRLLAEASLELAVGANAVGSADEAQIDVPDDASDLLIIDAAFAGVHRRALVSRTGDLAPMRRLAPADVVATVAADGDCWMVRLVAGHLAAAELRLTDADAVGWPGRGGAVYIRDNHVTLLPGEERTIPVEWRGVEPARRRLWIDGWNLDGRWISGG